MIGVRPFGLDDPTSWQATAGAVLVVLAIAAVCFAKGRIALGVFGLFIPVVAIVGAVRLAKPRSPWARWRYDEGKLERSRERFADSRPMMRAHRRLGDIVAGAPSEEP